MDNATKIEILVETRINGNSIKGCDAYENYLKAITKGDLKSYGSWTYGLTLYGTKLEMIEQIREHLEKR